MQLTTYTDEIFICSYFTGALRVKLISRRNISINILHAWKYTYKLSSADFFTLIYFSKDYLKIIIKATNNLDSN